MTSESKAPVIAIVGPSGVGKDSVMSGLAVADPQLKIMRRVITRTPEAGGEDYQSVSEAEFVALQQADAFALYWQAHGLHYGIPQNIDRLRQEGAGVLVNLSRAMLLQAQETFDDFRVISLTANRTVLAHRLAQRGRETEEEILHRLQRSDLPLPEGLNHVRRVDNSGAIQNAITVARAVIYAARS